MAAGKGYLHVLQWAREHGCPWNSKTCRNFVGNWAVVHWAVLNGVPMDNNDDIDDDDDDDDEYFNLADSAAAYNQWDIVQLAVDHGCKCSNSTIRKLCNKLSSNFKFYDNM
jgi:hypothetical protein